MTNIIEIRSRISEDIFDYQQLLDNLSHYGNIRNCIGRLLDSGEIIRIRKGLYTFAEPLRRSPLCRELLANLIYGPSYITADYALSYYGLIPERVTVLTSVTTGRSRSFSTPFGVFTYRSLSGAFYTPGATLETSGKSPFLIATPEKALIDRVWQDNHFSGTTISSYDAYLRDDQRLDFDRLRELDFKRFQEFAGARGSRKIDNLLKYIKPHMEKTNNE